MRKISFCSILCLLALSFVQICAGAEDPAIDRSLQKGIAFLRNSSKTRDPKARYLMAYTLVKTGTPPNDPFIAETVRELQAILSKSSVALQDHYYSAGVAAMMFDAIDGKKYNAELKKLADYIMAGQRSHGAWYYPSMSPGNPVGDTSITQYALLGLWAAERNGIQVPKTVWSRAATWLVNTQVSSGAFNYHPDEVKLDFRTGRPSLCAAGTSSLYLCKRQLYPNGFRAEVRKREAEEEKDENTKLYGGLLEVIDVTKSDEAPPDAETKDENQPNLISGNRLQSGINSGMRFIASLPEMGLKEQTWWLYYVYGIERLGAFAEIDTIGNKEWYPTLASALIKAQTKDGSWKGYESHNISTCFAVLFLYKATAKSIRPQAPPPSRIGSGLLAGGRGLPSDLKTVQQKDGKIVSESIDIPVTDLLTQLESSANADLKPIQEEVIETVRSEQRDELIGQVDRLVKLLKSPDADVRAIAVWSLARSNDLTKVPLLIDLIRKDPAYDVAREANLGLCVLSRRLKGVGFNDDPVADLDREANPKQAKERIDQWRASAAKAWQDWYLKIRAYRERDDLLELEQE